MYLIIIFVVVWLIYTGFRRSKADEELTKAAHQAKPTQQIVSTLRSLSNIKADKVDCKLFIKDMGQFSELIRLDIIITSNELAQFLEKKQSDMSKIQSEIDICDRTNDYDTALKLLEKIPRMRDQSVGEFTSFFSATPDTSLIGCFAQNNDYVVSENQVMGHTGYFGDDLGIPYSKYNIPYSPYILDAVAEAAKDIPNISLTIDKTIPSKKN